MDISWSASCFFSEMDVDLKQHLLCKNIMTAETGVLALIKPMLIVSPEDAAKLSSEMKLLFERILQETHYNKAEIVIAGSMREALKASRLDEVDVQIRLKGIEWPVPDRLGEELFFYDMIKELNEDVLVNSLRNIRWDGINLRPISISPIAPWKFLREGQGADRGLVVSVDVVLVLIHKTEEDPELETLISRVLRNSPKHFRNSYINQAKNGYIAKETTFALEWDIMDSLPMASRLAILIGKSLLEVSQILCFRLHFLFKY